ncbi:Acg family FMN-binding oxidoreductase [Nocardia beijingensis]|uniref:Acg family FMN-binding oxidoreductase n=1 Tax=Nocardia beijingensis TaxID=95162 RepID=UPI00189422C4|nr:NAD(P)H nitroreductase [Nocardia beijingensis]MBF6079358.1 NAD(P)H nitroreductase [Nocardia beijingensis]
MDRALPDDSIVETALALALRAPSRHNVQPWRWQIHRGSVHLYLDRTRALPMTEVHQRDVLLSCGAALHHLSVAFAALGWATIVRRMPDPDDPDHLAAVTTVAHRPTEQDLAMSAAITQRRSDRRNYRSWTIPPGYLGLLNERAAAMGALLRPLRELADDRLSVATQSAARAGDPAIGIRRYSSMEDAAACHIKTAWIGHDIPEATMAAAILADAATEPDHSDLLLLATITDDRLARLRAGEAMSAVLLTATNVGLATCPLSVPLENTELRARVRHDILDDTAHPQVILRVGQPPTSADPPPMTPRRSLTEVLASVET